MAVDVSGLHDLIETYAAEVGQVVRDELEATIKDAAPVGQSETAGQLRDSVNVDYTVGAGTIFWHVEATADEASYTDEGTDPHRIEGNPILAFSWPARGGGVFFFRAVNHPGTPAQHWFGEPMPAYFQDALDAAEAAVVV